MAPPGLNTEMRVLALRDSEVTLAPTPPLARGRKWHQDNRLLCKWLLINSEPFQNKLLN
jgi:hypothetical protein